VSTKSLGSLSSLGSYQPLRGLLLLRLLSGL
jgi:hypothetical protein